MMIPVGSVAQGLFLDPMIPRSLSLLPMGCKKRERGLQHPSCTSLDEARQRRPAPQSDRHTRRLWHTGAGEGVLTWRIPYLGCRRK